MQETPQSPNTIIPPPHEPEQPHRHRGSKLLLLWVPNEVDISRIDQAFLSPICCAMLQGGIDGWAAAKEHWASSPGELESDRPPTDNLMQELVELREAHPGSLLTPRQLEILKLVANGSRYKEIAKVIFVTERTVQREIRSIFNRLGANDAAHAVAEAYKQGIIEIIQTDPPHETEPTPALNWDMFEGRYTRPR